MKKKTKGIIGGIGAIIISGICAHVASYLSTEGVAIWYFFASLFIGVGGLFALIHAMTEIED